MNLEKNNLFQYKGIVSIIFFEYLLKTWIDLIYEGPVSIILPRAYKYQGTTLLISSAGVKLPHYFEFFGGS